MRAGLEGYNHRRPPSPFTCTRQCYCLGVAISEFRVPSFSNQLAILQDHRAYQGIGLDPSPTSPGEVQGAAHRFPLVHPALEAHSQAQAGEELSLSGVEVFEIGGEVLVLATLIPDLSSQPHHGHAQPGVQEPEYP